MIQLYFFEDLGQNEDLFYLQREGFLLCTYWLRYCKIVVVFGNLFVDSRQLGFETQIGFTTIEHPSHLPKKT